MTSYFLVLLINTSYAAENVQVIPMPTQAICEVILNRIKKDLRGTVNSQSFCVDGLKP